MAPAQLAALLAGHQFPGNVRELEAMIFNAVALSDGTVLSMEPFKDWVGSVRGSVRPELFPAVLGEMEHGVPTLKQAEERVIREALERAGGNQSVAAKMLGITRQALNRRLLTKKRKKTD